METKDIKKRMSKVGEWLNSDQKPYVDLSLMTVERRNLFMRRALK